MAPQSLISVSPLYSLPQSLKNPNRFSFRSSSCKHAHILCGITDSQAQQQQQGLVSNAPSVSISAHPPAGTGAAAPTRGDIFLERQQVVAAAASEAKKKKMKKKKKKLDAVLSSAIACCYGCGAPLQTSEVDAPGYVALETYELKKRHRQLRTVLCRRCKLLSHGHMITAVGGNGGYPGGKQFISAEELREKLSDLKHEKVLIVKLVDIVDFNGSFLARVRELAGANPIILVVTKVDLLPKGTDLNCVADWVVEATIKKKLNVLSVHLTSAKSSLGIFGVSSEIQRQKKGRDVYILGAANVGKSAFINALLKTMAQKDPVAAAARKYKPIQSAVPGTTLGPIQIDAFLGGGSEVGVLLMPPNGRQRVEDWPGLQTVRQLQIKFDDPKRPACDIAISGLGWITIEPISQSHEISGLSELKQTPEELHLAVHVPKPVEIFVRPPMPVGKAGGELYEYRELTEKEEESRPKWYI